MSAVTTTTTTVTTSDLSQETTNSPQLTKREVEAPSPASRAGADIAPPAVASSTASISGGRRSESSVSNSDAVEEGFAAELNPQARDNHRHHPGPSSLATYTYQIIIGILGFMAVISLTLMIATLLANRESFQPAWATIFLWSTTVLFFVVLLRRQQAQRAAAVNEALRRVEVQRALDKAVWQALLAYFTFNHSEDEQKGSKGDTAEIEEGTTTTNNDEGPQGSSHPDIMEKGSATMDPSKWFTTGTCIICLGEYRLGDRLCRMPCRHVFHAKCIDEWLDRAKEPCCPMCKKDLRGEESASSSSANTVASEPSGEGVSMDDTTTGIEEV